MSNLQESDKTCGRLFVQAKIWNVNAGVVTALKYDGRIFPIEDCSSLKQPDPEKPKQKPRNVKISYLQKWIQDNEFVVFTLEQFFKVYPRQRFNTKLAGNIARLLEKDMIVQMGKDKFKVKR